jgi:hypothetical protein
MLVKCWLISYCHGGIVKQGYLTPDPPGGICPVKDCPINYAAQRETKKEDSYEEGFYQPAYAREKR